MDIPKGPWVISAIKFFRWSQYQISAPSARLSLQSLIIVLLFQIEIGCTAEKSCVITSKVCQCQCRSLGGDCSCSQYWAPGQSGDRQQLGESSCQSLHFLFSDTPAPAPATLQRKQVRRDPDGEASSNYSGGCILHIRVPTFFFTPISSKSFDKYRLI